MRQEKKGLFKGVKVTAIDKHPRALEVRGLGSESIRDRSLGQCKALESPGFTLCSFPDRKQITIWELCYPWWDNFV